jgi:MarR family transcriptional regulator, transcriptional regulator for hemolysin
MAVKKANIEYLDPYESLGFQCNLTQKAFVAAMSKKFKGTGVSRAQFQALMQLVSAGGPLSMSELTSRLSITPATGAKLVDRMERDGWVVRQADPTDSRVKHVVVTGQVAKKWEKACRAARGLLREAYKGIDPADIETARRVLTRIRRNLGAG